jgi:hypothetical protein
MSQYLGAARVAMTLQVHMLISYLNYISFALNNCFDLSLKGIQYSMNVCMSRRWRWRHDNIIYIYVLYDIDIIIIIGLLRDWADQPMPRLRS